MGEAYQTYPEGNSYTIPHGSYDIENHKANVSLYDPYDVGLIILPKSVSSQISPRTILPADEDAISRYGVEYLDTVKHVGYPANANRWLHPRAQHTSNACSLTVRLLSATRFPRALNGSTRTHKETCGLAHFTECISQYSYCDMYGPYMVTRAMPSSLPSSHLSFPHPFE